MAPAHVKSSAATVGAGERAKPSTSDTSVVTAHRACAALYTLARCLLGARVQVGARPEISPLGRHTLLLHHKGGG